MFLAYYCDTQKQPSGELAKCIGKQLCGSPFLNKVAGGKPIKKETQTVFYNNIGVIKNFAKFTAKSMSKAASGISDNRSCLAGCNFFDVLHNWL